MFLAYKYCFEKSVTCGLEMTAGNGGCVEDMWKIYKDIIFEGIKRYVPEKILSKNPDPE